MSKLTNKLGIDFAGDFTIDLTVNLTLNVTKNVSNELVLDLADELALNLADEFFLNFVNKLRTKKIALRSLSKRIRITNPRVQHVLRYLRPPFCPPAAP